jgi:hypothetical protein
LAVAKATQLYALYWPRREFRRRPPVRSNVYLVVGLHYFFLGPHGDAVLLVRKVYAEDAGGQPGHLLPALAGLRGAPEVVGTHHPAQAFAEEVKETGVSFRSTVCQWAPPSEVTTATDL